MSSSLGLAHLDRLPKIKIRRIPFVVDERLQRHSREIIRLARERCRGTFIEYSPKNRCLIIGGLPEKRQKAMMSIYDLLEAKGIRYNE